MRTKTMINSKNVDISDSSDNQIIKAIDRGI